MCFSKFCSFHAGSSKKNWEEAIPAGNYTFKVNNRNTRTECEICPKLTIKTPEWRQGFYCQLWTYFTLCSSVSIVNFEHVNAGWKVIVLYYYLGSRAGFFVDLLFNLSALYFMTTWFSSKDSFTLPFLTFDFNLTLSLAKSYFTKSTNNKLVNE